MARPLRAIAVTACAFALAAVTVSCIPGGESERPAARAAPARVTSPPLTTPAVSTTSTPRSPTPATTRRPTGPASRPPARSTTSPPPAGLAYPYGAISMTGTSAVALTFDDGPTWTWTEQMLAVLREHGVKATFCVIGKMARTYPSRIQQIAADGHTLCNHSDDHNVKLGTLSEAAIRANLQATNDAIHAAVPDARISYFRHPGGAWTPLAIKVAAEMGMTSLHWDVDPRDYLRPGSQAIADYVMTHTRPGSIVLLHDGGGDRSGTVEACRLMLSTLKSRFQLIPLPPRPAP